MTAQIRPGTDQLEVGEPAGPASHALDPTARQRLVTARRPLLVLALVLFVAVVIGIGRSGDAGGYLDPNAATPAGARALRVLLTERGVTVTVVPSSQAALTAAGAGDTLVVITAADASAAELTTLARSRADLVLVDPTPTVLARLAPWLTPAGSAPAEPRDPVCDLPAAVRAGRAVTGGLTFAQAGTGEQPASMCYAANGTATLARATLAGGRTVTVFGSGAAFTNDLLGTEGDAALALNLLGAHSRLAWYIVPNNLADTSGTRPLSQLLPPWLHPVELQLAIAVLLLALWQGRRFGPVVEESLPVVVRASEAAEGRARLYHRAGARDRAASNLRAAAVARIIALVGQSRSANPVSITEAVAARTGRPAADIGAVLYGAAPVDDTALVRLASDLDALERMVRHP